MPRFVTFADFHGMKYSHQATNMKLRSGAGTCQLQHTLLQRWQRMLKNHLEINLRPAHISAWSCLPRKQRQLGVIIHCVDITWGFLELDLYHTGFWTYKGSLNGKIPVGWLGPTLGITLWGQLYFPLDWGLRERYYGAIHLAEKEQLTRAEGLFPLICSSKVHDTLGIGACVLLSLDTCILVLFFNSPFDIVQFIWSFSLVRAQNLCLDNDDVTQVIFIAHWEAKDVSHCGQGAKVLSEGATKYGAWGPGILLFVGCRDSIRGLHCYSTVDC